MKSLGLFETKNKLSEICEQVARTAEPMVVTKRGKPLVQIIPYKVPGKPKSVWGSVAESRAKYGELTEELELPERSAKHTRPDPLD